LYRARFAFAFLFAIFGERAAGQRLAFSCAPDWLAPSLTQADLVTRFGNDNVVTDSILRGEGEFERGTVLFPRDVSRRVDIVWQDSLGLRWPEFVRIRGDSSAWRGPSGVHLGTTLRVLERVNGKPFRLAGFGFDGSGFVTSWAKGALEHPGAPGCSFRVNLEPTVRSPQNRVWYNQLRGDREFSSAHPAMRALNPRVIQMELLFPPMKKPSSEGKPE
jgi:hypothetical protein